jgi:hypothetical protein
VNVTTADGATLEASKLSSADSITVAGSTTSTVSAADADTFGARLSGAGTLTVSGYTNQELSDITTTTVNVTTADGAVLSSSKLSTADSITVAGSTTSTVSAADADTFGARLSGAGTLTVSGYTNQELSDITTTTVNVTTADGAVLSSSKLSSADSITVAGSTTSTVSAADAIGFGSKLGGSGTLSVIAYTTQDLSSLAASLTVQATLESTTTIADSKLSGVDQITVAANTTVTLDDEATLTELDRFVLDGEGATLALDQLARPKAASLVSIRGTAATDEAVILTTSSSGAVSVNLKQISDIAGVDSFLINADTQDSVLSVRLSEALSRSTATEVRLDGGSGKNSRDTILFESSLIGASTGSSYDATTTWAELGLGGANITNFVPNKDSFGVVDSAGAFVFNTWQLGLPKTGEFNSDGKVYLDISGFVDIDSVSEVRSYIGDNVASTNNGIDTGFALINTDVEGNLDIGLFHVKWIGANSSNPTAGSSDLLVTRVGVLQDVDPDATLGLTSVIAAPNFIAKTIPTGLA